MVSHPENGSDSPIGSNRDRGRDTCDIEAGATGAVACGAEETGGDTGETGAGGSSVFSAIEDMWRPPSPARPGWRVRTETPGTLG